MIQLMSGPAAASRLTANRNFRLLWGGDAAGQFGAQIAGFALPIFAVQYLNATEQQMGYLNAAESAAFLVIGLPVGAWVDHMRKRRVMIVADLVRAALLTALVVVALSGLANIPILILVALCMSVCNTFFDVSYQSFVPALVGPEHLVEGNSKLEATRAVAMIGGPAVGGLLLRFMSAANLLGATVLTYLVSAFTLAKIDSVETLPPAQDRRPLLQEIRSGLSYVLTHRVLRRIVATTAISNIFSAIGAAAVTIYILRFLGVSTEVYGLVFAIGSVGSLLGALVADKMTGRLGHLAILPVSAFAWGVFNFLDPLAGFASGIWVPIMLTANFFLSSVFIVVYNIAQVSYRQKVCPPELLGRMNASVRFIIWGVIPIGGLIGGFLGQALGVWPTMWIAAAGGVFAVLPVLPALWRDLETKKAGSQQE